MYPWSGVSGTSWIAAKLVSERVSDRQCTDGLTGEGARDTCAYDNTVDIFAAFELYIWPILNIQMELQIALTLLHLLNYICDPYLTFLE